MGHKLLLADDSITIQKVVGIIFAHDDYELTVVDNGDAALEKARESVPDIILADALMPGKNGYEVCRVIRKDPSLAHVPALLMTGVFEPFDEVKARESGADDFITKPFESQHLIEKVKKLIEVGKSRGKAAPAPAAAPLAAAASAPLPAAAAVPAGGAFGGVEILEVSSEDDLWGALEVEEETGEEVVFGEVFEEEEASAPLREDVFAEEALPVEETPGEEDFFGFEEELEAQPAPDVFAFEEEAAPAAAADPFAFDIEDEPAAVEEILIETTVPASIDLSPVEQEFEVFPEEEEEPVSVFAPDTAAEAFFAEEVTAPEPLAVAAAAPSGSITLTEEQLTAAISRISREIIEKIAWEVVPDLAESMIREELRKIKEGV